MVLISVFMTVKEISRGSERFQWDTHVYYTAPINYSQGQDPYKENIFVYPPLFLPVLKLIPAFFSEAEFYIFFLSLKIICFLFLLFLWRKYFLQETSFFAFTLLTWLGFNSAFSVDFYAGNITVFEVTLLFLAFMFLLAEEVKYFVLFILLASFFKIVPLFFLILLPLLDFKKYAKHFLFGILGFAIYALINWMVFPQFTSEFVFEALHRTAELGRINPSTWSFFKEVVQLGNQYLGMTIDFTWMFFMIFCGFIYYYSLKAWSVYKKNNTELDRKLLIFFAITIFCVTAPRMKDYLFILVIPSLIYGTSFLRQSIPVWVGYLPFLVASKESIRPFLFRDIYNLADSYYPLGIALLLWYLFYKKLRDQPLKV
jgi:hypothetical protein